MALGYSGWRYMVRRMAVYVIVDGGTVRWVAVWYSGWRYATADRGICGWRHHGWRYGMADGGMAWRMAGWYNDGGITDDGIVSRMAGWYSGRRYMVQWMAVHGYMVYVDGGIWYSGWRCMA